MASQRPPSRGNFPPRGPRSASSGSSSARRPQGSSGPTSDRKGQPPRRPAPPSRPRPSKPSGPRANAAAPGEDRLQKILAHAGVGSRRACEDLILQGRVTVGGQVIKELGTKVDLAKISVAVDGQKIQQERLVYFAVNKPKGFVSTNNDPAGRPRVLDILPEIPQRVYTVGRLDEMSVGLLLLTNDGELANKLAHPRFGVEKLYRVIVAGTPEREVLNQLTEGIWLAEGKVRAKRVRAVAKKGDATILELVLAEGKNREVRRMLAKLGHKVMMLTRVAVGPITLKGLAPGQYRPLTGREVDLLRRVAAGEPVPMPWMTDRRPTRPETNRPRGVSAPGSADRRPVREPNDQAGPRRAGPPASQRGPERPHGPGYRGHEGDDRRSGPPVGGPPRRPGMFQPPLDDSRRFRDDRPVRSSGGPPQGSRGPARPPRQGETDSRPPRPGSRPGGGRPMSQGEGQRSQSGPPRRPGGDRSMSVGEGQRPPSGPPRRPGGNRSMSVGEEQRPASGPPRRPGGDDRRAQAPSGPRPGPRPSSDQRRPPTNRRLPDPGLAESQRKVIGLNNHEVQEPSDDRPKPRLKRPAPRGAAPSAARPLPKRKPGRRQED